jgi:hypothetical protein
MEVLLLNFVYECKYLAKLGNTRSTLSPVKEVYYYRETSNQMECMIENT